VALIGLGAVGYAAGFLVSIYLAVGSIITLGIGVCVDRPRFRGTAAEHAGAVNERRGCIELREGIARAACG
jgi:hypothetical protein